MDHVNRQHRWGNSVAGVDSDTSAHISTDHCPVTFKIRTKLSRIARTTQEKNPAYLKPTEEDNEQVNDVIRAPREDDQDIENEDERARIMIAAAEATLRNKKVHGSKHDYITPETWKLIEARGEAKQHKAWVTAAQLTKKFGKLANRDKDTYMKEQLDTMGEQARWAQINMLNNGYKPRFYETCDGDGHAIPNTQQSGGNCGLPGQQAMGETRQKGRKGNGPHQNRSHRRNEYKTGPANHQK